MQPAVAPHQGRGGAGRFFNFRRMKRILRHILPVILCLPALGGCMKWDYADMEEFAATGPGLFITNEGNFQYGNATLSYYDPATKKVENEVFYRANAMKLGDVAQSMTIHNDLGWIVVNNSHVVFAIDLRTFKEVGRITNLTSPRYIHFVSDEKAYVTQLWDNRIFIVNPRRYEITGYIECPGMTPGSGSTEQMVQYGQYVYVNCWSYQNRLLKIDTRTDRVGTNWLSAYNPHRWYWMPTTSCGRSPTAVTKAAPTDMMFRHCTASTPPRSAWKSSSVSERGMHPQKCSSTARATRCTGSTRMSGACPWLPSSSRRARSSNTGRRNITG